MKKNGHTFINISRIDIEGAKFETLDGYFDVYDRPPTSGLSPISVSSCSDLNTRARFAVRPATI
jgi:hypothetical protein